MSSITPTLKFNKLQYSNDKEEYKLYKSALEWNLIEPIVINNEKDIKSRQDWEGLLEPYHHQVNNLITFCKRLPVTLISDDVGLGKTISAGLIVSELMARGHIQKILVICPKILIPQWDEELKTKFNIDSVEVTGKKILNVSPPKDFGAVITTYQTASLYLDRLGKRGFDMLILDEAHKLRNLYGVPQTPQVAIQFKKALSERMFRYVLMLTATPIHNRLWDIYSLIELLTIARGHDNPFGKEGIFAQNFISDSRTKARQLNLAMKDEFRSIVYSYMSRTRRDDVELLFPERVVHSHKVEQTPEEIEIFELIKEPIQSLPFFVQISVLQAYVSSPYALAKQLENSAKKENFPLEVAGKVRNIVKKMKTIAKLNGLSILINKLKKEQGVNWRIVIFTERRETQTAIEDLLEKQGITCGIINGDSAIRNREAIERFRNTPPDAHVIVSTRAGSEGVNLQSANVLVNFDLPWNPMIVEQRIGRVQRLASEHAKVSIFNVILKDTFEEYIVGRLMEKLQMASHAIGDIESLLEATSLNGEDDDKGIEEKIRELVMASIEGKDMNEATRLIAKSVDDAKLKLEKEEKNINDMLGGKDGSIDFGPETPKLPPLKREITYKDFTLLTLKKLGANLTENPDGNYKIDLDGNQETIRFEHISDNTSNSTLCRPGSPFFSKLVTKITNLSLHTVEDLDKNITDNCEIIANEWVKSFNGEFNQYKIKKIRRRFNGNVILYVSITNSHDKYERLLNIKCKSNSNYDDDLKLLNPIGKYLKNPKVLGLSEEYLKNKTIEDSGVSEFCRFYNDRLNFELKSIDKSKRKKKKLERDFTPHIEITTVGLEGKLHRELAVDVYYNINSEKYQSNITISPHNSIITEKPKLKKCEKTDGLFPENCLKKCQVSKMEVLAHLLIKSDLSNRYALPENVEVCSLSGKKVMPDEIEISDISGKSICKGELITSSLSGKKGEPEYFEKCEFSSTLLLKTEIKVSQISNKKYRKDEELISYISGKRGHRDEFIFSSITEKPLLKNESIQSNEGTYCSKEESQICNWSGEKMHPSDLSICKISGLTFNSIFIKNGMFDKLYTLLNGSNIKTDKTELWNEITGSLSQKLGKNILIENAEVSKDNNTLACSLIVKKWYRFKPNYAGFLYSIDKKVIIGKVKIGERSKLNWLMKK